MQPYLYLGATAVFFVYMSQKKSLVFCLNLVFLPKTVAATFPEKDPNSSLAFMVWTLWYNRASLIINYKSQSGAQTTDLIFEVNV